MDADAVNYPYNALRLKVIAGKTKVLESKSLKHQYSINQEQIEMVEHFCYLSRIVSAKLDMNLEIERRIQSAATAFNRLRKRVFERSGILLNKSGCIQTCVAISPICVRPFQEGPLCR